MLVSGHLYRDKEDNCGLYKCRDTSSVLTKKMLHLRASIGVPTGVYGGHNKNLIPDRGLNRDIMRMSSPTRFRETNGGVFGRCCIGESMYLVCRRDLLTPFCVLSWCPGS